MTCDFVRWGGPAAAMRQCSATIIKFLCTNIYVDVDVDVGVDDDDDRWSVIDDQ